MSSAFQGICHRWIYVWAFYYDIAIAALTPSVTGTGMLRYARMVFAQMMTYFTFLCYHIHAFYISSLNTEAPHVCYFTYLEQKASLQPALRPPALRDLPEHAANLGSWRTAPGFFFFFAFRSDAPLTKRHLICPQVCSHQSHLILQCPNVIKYYINSWEVGAERTIKIKLLISIKGSH